MACCPQFPTHQNHIQSKVRVNYAQHTNKSRSKLRRFPKQTRTRKRISTRNLPCSFEENYTNGRGVIFKDGIETKGPPPARKTVGLMFFCQSLSMLGLPKTVQSQYTIRSILAPILPPARAFTVASTGIHDGSSALRTPSAKGLLLIQTNPQLIHQ